MSDYIEELAQVEDELAVVETELQELLERQSLLLDKRAELKAILAQQSVTNAQQTTKTWEGTDFPWTQALDQKLKSVFKLSSLRPMQRQTMNATLSKEDCMLIMPTGGGKSLCFQLPALVDKGLTLVVSPLVSLMEDQQMSLEQLGVPSAMLNAATDKNDLKRVQDDIVSKEGKLRLLYVTPEKLAKSKRFMNRLEKCYAIGHLARLVIDEVHCCSQWGHDFRPDYKFLGIMKRQFPNAPILGLTATATVKVLEDVRKILNIPRALLFKASFNRPNLYYEVREKPSSQKETMDEIYHIISRRFRGQSGIVYCFSRKDSEEVAADLQSRGVKAGCYHADMDAKSRSLVHRKWLSGEIHVVVATVAFGMGIDKPDVRFVLHHTISKSMENLYQESGRAGRDDQRSDCIVLYRFADVARQSSMVFTEQTGLANLHGITRYCTDVGSCRRSIIACHFGEMWDSSQCNGMCDHCDRAKTLGPAQKRDVTRLCLDILSILDAASSTDQRVTSAKLVDAWYGRGPTSLKVKSVGVPGIGRDKAERILAHMLVNGFVQEDFHFTAYSTICYIVPGPKAKLLRSNATKIMMDFPAKPGKSPVASTSTSTPSSSTAPSSSSAKRSQSSSSGLKLKSKSSSTSDKPKLVVVNKEKSHFSSLSTSQSFSPTTQSSASPKTVSSSKTSPAPHLKSTDSGQATPIRKSKSENEPDTRTQENDTLNFDDSDEGIERKKPAKSLKLKRKQNNALDILDSDSDRESMNGTKSVSAKRRKTTKNCIAHSSDDDNDDDGADNVGEVKTRKKSKKTEGAQKPFFTDIKLDKEKRHSIIISDDDDDDDDFVISS